MKTLILLSLFLFSSLSISQTKSSQIKSWDDFNEKYKELVEDSTYTGGIQHWEKTKKALDTPENERTDFQKKLVQEYESPDSTNDIVNTIDLKKRVPETKSFPKFNKQYIFLALGILLFLILMSLFIKKYYKYETQIPKLARFTIFTNKLIKYLLILFVMSYGTIKLSSNLSYYNMLNETTAITFESDEELLKKLANTPNHEEQQALMQANIDQKTFETRYGRKLKQGETNPYSPNNSFPLILSTGLIIIVCIVLIIFIHLLFKPIINLWENKNSYHAGNIILDQFTKKWNLSLICTLIITILLVVPTFGLSIILMTPQIILLIKTKNVAA